MTHHLSQSAGFDREGLVYVKRLDSDDIERLVAPNMLESIEDPSDLFAVYDSEGQAIAVVEGRQAAFEAARSHKLTPSSVH